MEYRLDSASSKELNIKWGNFKKVEDFSENYSNAKFTRERFIEQWEANSKSRTDKGYSFGFKASSGSQAYEVAKAFYKNSGRLFRETEDSFTLGHYEYSIEINSLEDLHRLRKEFSVPIILYEDSITIYDDYLE